jgi:hypothetical protein
MGSHGGALGFSIPWLRNIAPRPDPEQPEVTVVLQPEVGHLIHARLRKLKHGERVVLGTFLAVFGSWNDVGPFEVEYTISTTEHSEKITGKLPLIVTKTVELPKSNTEEDSAGADEPEGS